MNKRAMIVLFGLGLAAAAQLATPAGLETRQLSFSITYVMSTATGRYNHVYTGRCDVQAIGTSAYGTRRRHRGAAGRGQCCARQGRGPRQGHGGRNAEMRR